MRALPVLLAAAMIGCGAGTPAPQGKGYSDRPSSCGADAGVWARDLGLERSRELTLCLLNAERAREGLGPLREDPRLELAAQRYAQEMVAGQFFAHDSPSGTDPQDRVLMAGYPSQSASSGENLAWGTGSEGSPVEIVDGWMHSPGHRANILRAAFAEVGIGIEFDVPERRDGAPPGSTYVTNFGGAPLPY